MMWIEWKPSAVKETLERIEAGSDSQST